MSKNIEIKFMVFNGTDGFFASPDQMTKEEAEKFVREFPLRFAQQGYYLTSKWERINPHFVELEIRPVIIREKSKSKDKGRSR